MIAIPLGRAVVTGAATAAAMVPASGSDPASPPPSGSVVASVVASWAAPASLAAPPSVDVGTPQSAAHAGDVPASVKWYGPFADSAVTRTELTMLPEGNSTSATRSHDG